MKNINKKGFTLIEMLVVVLIIGILAAVALPQYFKAVEKSRSSEALSVMGSISAAMERGRLVDANNHYPAALSELDIEFNNADGTAATETTINTTNFTITLYGVGAAPSNNSYVEAVRKGATSGYKLKRMYYTGKVTCTDSTDTGVSTSGMCKSLGLQTEAAASV